MDKIPFNEDKILDALNRSGYLLESEISKNLTEAGFFVETNQVIQDRMTGKSREIDLTADYYDWQLPDPEKCYSTIKFAFEIKNNSAPIVLLTKFQNSINIEDWEGIKEWVTIPEGLHYYQYGTYLDSLIRQGQSIFTQYCSFQDKKQKNGELMALHPDNIYEGLQKITQYCEEQTGVGEDIAEKPDGYFRHVVYMPVLLFSDDLYELHYSEQSEPKLKKVESSILVYNYHSKEKPTMAYVFVVTKNGFNDFMQSMIKLANNIEEQLREIRREKNNNVT